MTKQNKTLVMAYKGPPKDLMHKIGHWGICVFSSLRWFLRTGKFKKVIYSHVELNINGLSYTSSSRDGGVREKQIDIHSGAWDLFEVNINETYALNWFLENEDKKYDWAGIFRFLLPFLPHGKDQYFCNEAVGCMMRVPNSENYTPDEFIELIKKKYAK